ncbi:hypothetical protein UFOVP1288_21 [uncultured Caudovirales phage]|uniref:Uncharacterized protein n=1 Tax=uncultured Caudovirales phage TaxID=2100421 RepID=A0A6J5R8K5_9CAUD|nr:hypothetical protein UFOVP1195_21 [uncultured Caudovirales phage]CAB4195528.1 hypothetical protein UFOVP1288_21 [uncultured Caudovirales phage]CAB4204922.1 hypothetical protein UFOVP1409_21 [uncultured Caudovirales phage]
MRATSSRRGRTNELVVLKNMGLLVRDAVSNTPCGFRDISFGGTCPQVGPRCGSFNYPALRVLAFGAGVEIPEMIYHPTYIEVKAVRLIGGKTLDAVKNLEESLAKCTVADPDLLNKIFTSQRKLYREAVKAARKAGWTLER